MFNFTFNQFLTFLTQNVSLIHTDLYYSKILMISYPLYLHKIMAFINKFLHPPPNNSPLNHAK